MSCTEECLSVKEARWELRIVHDNRSMVITGVSKREPYDSIERQRARLRNRETGHRGECDLCGASCPRLTNFCKPCYEAALDVARSYVDANMADLLCRQL